MPTAAEVLERVFTSVNPATGSRPPPAMAWAVFEHGTFFYTDPSSDLPATASFDQIAAAALAALDELGPVQAGTPAGDFNPTRLEGWYPDHPVWFVSYDHPRIATVIELEATDVAAGLTARSHRQLDHDERKIVLVRRFNGTAEVR